MKSVSYIDVCKLALALPNVKEGSSYGAPTLKAKGKLFVRLRQDLDAIVVRMPFALWKEMVAEEPETYFIIDHYRDYEWMLVRLSRLHPDALPELLRLAYEAATRSKRQPANQRQASAGNR